MKASKPGRYRVNPAPNLEVVFHIEGKRGGEGDVKGEQTEV